MEGHSTTTWFNYLPGLEHVSYHLSGAFFVAIVLVLFGAIATLKMKAAKEVIVPESKLSFRNFFEIIAEKLYGFCENVMGRHAAEHYFPLIGTLFLYVFACNILGLLPGMLPPTDDYNVTFSAGVFVFLYYNFHGIKANGLAGHFKHLCGPVWWLAWLIFPIELISHVFRPITLGLRLKGNMMGDHMVLGTFLNLPPYVGVPVIFYALGVFVSFVQAFVFCLLTMVYINLSTAHDH